jgi:GTP pyrophosphokinase
MMEWRTDVNDAQEFVEGMKSDVFQDRVYVFTPRGDIIDLSAGSTPIDFAYHVHTDIGHRCRGARVNGKLVPLYQDLKTGDQVEILTAKRGGPSRDWLNPNLGLVKTQRARSKIKAWFKKQEDEQNLAQGRVTLERELQRLGITNINFEKMARELGFKLPEEMFIALGNGDLSVNKVIKHLSETEETADILQPTIPAQDTKPSTDAVEVVGLKGLLSTVARCCNPMPGDQIVGYITRGRGATIHRQDCPNILRRKDTERLLQVDWGKVERTFPVHITVKAYDRQGLMGDISTLLQAENVNIADVSINFNRTVADIKLVVEIRDLAQLSRVLTRIESLPNVLEAQRTRPG